MRMRRTMKPDGDLESEGAKGTKRREDEGTKVI